MKHYFVIIILLLFGHCVNFRITDSSRKPETIVPSGYIVTFLGFELGQHLADCERGIYEVVTNRPVWGGYLDWFYIAPSAFINIRQTDAECAEAEFLPKGKPAVLAYTDTIYLRNGNVLSNVKTISINRDNVVIASNNGSTTTYKKNEVREIRKKK
jgi:hypothetical protein